ncbi:hypothetical protein [Pseudonocardia lacus]|uniref:hypothetical protein n=1 Tax=Pseudonocardia lacus TaxID=2835865 RepID=UPI001BDC0000
MLDLRFLERKALLVGRVDTVDRRGRRTVRYTGVHAGRADLADLVAADPDEVSTMACASLLDVLGVEGDLLTVRPELLWQQPASRLRWAAPPTLAELLDREDRRRAEAGDPPWLQLIRPAAPTAGRQDVEDGNRPGVIASESAELRELHRRNRLIEQENEVLRKAAVYSSQAVLPGQNDFPWSTNWPGSKWPSRSRCRVGCSDSPARPTTPGSPTSSAPVTSTTPI